MIRRLFKWTGAAIGLLLLVFLAYQGYVLVRLWWWVDHNPTTTAFMNSRLEVLREKKPSAQLQHVWVPYAKVSSHLKRAILVAEDDKFVHHEGFDWEGIQKALEKNQKKGKVVAGGSTITQQLAKNLLLSGERTLLRKGQEFVLTLLLEQILSKERILEIYLNNVEWGEGVFGAEAAAQHYFKKSAAQLTPTDAARLAVMLPAPKRFEKTPGSAYLAGRTRTILGRMGSAELP